MVEKSKLKRAQFLALGLFPTYWKNVFVSAFHPLLKRLKKAFCIFGLVKSRCITCSALEPGRPFLSLSLSGAFLRM
jgi:hypothetical protein